MKLDTLSLFLASLPQSLAILNLKVLLKLHSSGFKFKITPCGSKKAKRKCVCCGVFFGF
ncbi:hypothetical protein [Helicobacter trogontum]|uniref:hypothetical protein n=1 Tax=Helicobacter trogontum TaxID=50960 RepID=UPI00138702CE|nr:hypothetical protein [Helicobacter trogontum]